jgi:hypothetical protein
LRRSLIAGNLVARPHDVLSYGKYENMPNAIDT